MSCGRAESSGSEVRESWGGRRRRGSCGHERAGQLAVRFAVPRPGSRSRRQAPGSEKGRSAVPSARSGSLSRSSRAPRTMPTCAPQTTSGCWWAASGSGQRCGLTTRALASALGANPSSSNRSIALRRAATPSAPDAVRTAVPFLETVLLPPVSIDGAVVVRNCVQMCADRVGVLTDQLREGRHRAGLGLVDQESRILARGG